MDIPILDTPRLALRAHGLKDFPRFEAMWSDPAVTRYLGDGAPRTADASWELFLGNAGSWALLGYGSWAVEEKVTGAFVGGVGFRGADRRIVSTAQDAWEIGWIFDAPAAGKGYATEAATAVLEWGRSRNGHKRVVAIIASENAASIRVAQKCGFKEVDRTVLDGRPRLLCERFL